MIRRVILAALLAGIAAGIFMSAIQEVRITPLIIEAEKYEAPEVDSKVTTSELSTAEQPSGTVTPAAESEPWGPSNGLERTLYTTSASVVTGAGFAVLLAGLSLLTGIPITPRNGIIWGLCGFIAITLAPSAGLPPALPGVPAGDLAFRQIWWLATVLATGLGLYLIATARSLWPIAAAIAVIAAPHFISLPEPADPTSAVPPILAAVYVSNVLAAAAIFWSLTGVFLGLAMKRFAKEIYAT